ncbi:hypothetical protein PHYSODRAFT_296886 [Phytophthora sojae]|uniref:Uncharacterized protein n=1 Tax=Phytophthora sojae (strain P6497) TaxID=1094619 RepID=G4YX44_PHYSP|nr:hypothetical protein PHYSODRAFT_296886 [Phytophthora sojae]EGZ25051.1 hypothetical protein PHYSODRAFT_296886 [Phytophthora sojae]|eukprot:XP_009520339.1 hypothetical protein PHYSODRAFT_296886 [Phytophthora sojae]
MARCMLFESGLPLKFGGGRCSIRCLRAQQEPNQCKLRAAAPTCGSHRSHAESWRNCGIRIAVYCAPGPSEENVCAARSARDHCGKSDETKGFSVYLPNIKKVVVTQHSQNITTLSDSQNTQWQREMLEASQSSDSVEASTGGTEISGPKKKRRSARLKQKTSVGAAPQETRSTAGQTSGKAAKQEEHDVANAVREADPRNYGEAMRSSMLEKWIDAMNVEIEALEANDVWTIE